MLNWEIILVTMICSAFFSGMEIAFVTSNKLKTELDKNKGYLSARIISRFQKAPSDFIATMLVGNSISLVIYGIVMGNILQPFILKIFPANISSEFMIMITQTIISTLLILVTAEFLPKILFRIRPNNILNFFAVPVFVVYYLLYPVTFITISVSEFLLKIFFGIKIVDQKHVFGPVDLDNYVKEFFPDARNDDELEHEIQIFQNAMDFPAVKLRECMVPRTEIVAIDSQDEINNLKKRFIETGLTKILVYNDSVDNITGYAHSYDMFRNPATIQSILRPVSFVPETMPANGLLTIFIQQRRSMAVVVDEFGSTAGMITMEDVIEEIFGEIHDEFDVEELIEKQMNETEFLFSGRLEIDYINEKYRIELPESDDYETLSGLIMHFHQSIPQKNEKIEIGNFVFTIQQVSKTRIEQVHIIIYK
ncbi:MAG: hemolysin family protein [Bacteroidota bacterium]